MMRFGIPALPAAARRSRRRDPADRRPRRRRGAEPHGDERPRRDARQAGFDAVFLAVGAHLGKRAYIPAGSAAKILDAVSLLRSMEGEERAAARPPRRRLRRRQHRDRRGPDREAARRGGGDHRLPPHPRPHAGPRLRGRGGRARRACSMKWLSTIKHVDDGKLVVERMELDETGFPQPTGELEELEADSLVLALGQETDLSLARGRPRARGRGRRRLGRPEDDDRLRRHLRRRRHGPRRAHRDGRGRPRQAGGAQHRRLAARAPSSRRLRSARPPTSSS